jgi:hypothetical protein
MPELGPYGSVRGARGNSRPYRESDRRTVKVTLMTYSRRPAVLESIIDGSDRVSCPKADGLSLRRLRGYQLPLAAPQEEMGSAK